MLDDTLLPKVGGGFSLVMTLEDPRKLPELMGKLIDPANKERIDAALRSLDYIHFARFLPIFQDGQAMLLIVTEYDGVMRDYVMDFAVVLDREFSLILSYMKDRPALPVSENPEAFWAYVHAHVQKDTSLFSAYEGKTVLEIVGPGKRKTLPPRPDIPRAVPDLADVQANILFGYHGCQGRHVGVHFPSTAEGLEFVRALCPGNALQVTPSEPRPAARGYCLNLGFTHAGLGVLGVPAATLGLFPAAFSAGPAQRAELVGDAGISAPGHWSFGRDEDALQVHAVVSLYGKTPGDIDGPSRLLDVLLEKLRANRKDRVIAFEHRGATLDDKGTIHFEYRDGISQPRIAGVKENVGTAHSPMTQPGDFLLGTGYVNSRGSRYIGRLPPELAQNATYAAFRVIEQHIEEFEGVLTQGEGKGVARELVAAKLMGRWRNGSPLSGNPTQPDPEAPHKTGAQLDDFDYVAPPGAFDDPKGLRCPIGAHIRRFNPRSGMVLGVPWGRLVLRRGLPYGSAYPGKPDGEERGLLGMFMCGDLESQFEFLLGVWGRHDLSADGLRGTQDAFASAPADDAKQTTPFSFHAREDDADPITIDVPPLTRTRGALYLFMPGLKAIEWIAEAAPKRPAAAALPGKAAILAAGPVASIAAFDPDSAEFRADPYRFYASFRQQDAVFKVGGAYNSHWVFSHALVDEVCGKRADVFLKPGKNRDLPPRPFSASANFDDGLFFMDPVRHTEVRSLMNGVFDDAITPLLPQLRKRADALLDALAGRTTASLVADFASKLPTQVFMDAMGIPPDPGERFIVDQWTRAMLAGHSTTAGKPAQIGGGTASMALRFYLLGLATEKHEGEHPTIMTGMQKVAGCPADPQHMKRYEVMNTASHFALGGYLSTEFLITTGIYNLLRHPGQWADVAKNRSLLANAIEEMLRYDAPFQMADRWVAEDCELGGKPLKKGDKLTVVYGSANRDEDAFPGFDPGQFDIRHAPLDAAYGFGHGIHHCIGAPLGRAVAYAALDALLDRFPQASLLSTGDWLHDPYFRSLTEVNVALK